tara:strand:- start:4 stop:174 length:171 start_codon:yes stop_codon:yes gene_type:complete
MARSKPATLQSRVSSAIDTEVWEAIQKLARAEYKTGAGKISQYIMEGYARDLSSKD